MFCTLETLIFVNVDFDTDLNRLYLKNRTDVTQRQNDHFASPSLISQ